MITSPSKALRQLWDARDVRYGNGSGAGLTDAQVEAVRAYRIREAAEVGGPETMIQEAARWTPPPWLRPGRFR
jgi:hypothetical protein